MQIYIKKVNNTENLIRRHKISRAAMERIRMHGRTDIKPELAKALNLTTYSIYRLLLENKPNGPLTTVAAVEIISHILEIEPEEVLTEVNES